MRAKNIGNDIAAGLNNIVGGERDILICSHRQGEAFDRMIAEAEGKGADAVVNIRFTTSQAMAEAAELLAYGTAKLKSI